MNQSQQEKWVEQFYTCRQIHPTLVDMTPDNLRLPGLPNMMFDLYGDAARNLRFVIVLREPAARFQSGFYQEDGPRYLNETFFDHVKAVMRVAEVSKSTGWTDGIETNYYLDEFFRSMYSLNLKPWLEAFTPKQFMIVPMGAYFKDIASRRDVIHDLHVEFGCTARPELVAEESRVNVISHPSVESDLGQELLDEINKQFFNPDTTDLAQMLADAIPQGLTLEGYHGSATDPVDIESFLRENW